MICRLWCGCRYLLLYHYGGTYVDLDVIGRTPLAEIFANAPVSAWILVVATQPIGVATEFIAVRRPRDAVIGGVIAGLRRAAVSLWYPPLPYTAVMYRSGPVYFSRLLACYDRSHCSNQTNHVFVMPPTKYNSYVRHLPGASWHAWDGRIIWKLYQLRHRLYKVFRTLAALTVAFVIIVLVVRNRRRFVVRFRYGA